MTRPVDRFYADLTERLLTAMAAGELPWRKPWRGGSTPLPLRACGTAYRGINTIALWLKAEDAVFSGAHWMTYRQAQSLGGQVRHGEKGTQVIKYGTHAGDEDASDNSDTARRVGFTRVYTVFNTSQIEGLPDAFQPMLPEVNAGISPIAAYERFFAATGLPIEIGGTRACYIPTRDIIEMPPHALFEDAHAFYRVLSHEIAHNADIGISLMQQVTSPAWIGFRRNKPQTAMRSKN